MGRPEPVRRRPLLSALPKLLLYALVVGGIGVLVNYYLLAPRQVSVAEVETRTVMAEVQGTGTVTTRVQPRVGTKINGRVEKVLVDEGDVVRAGDLVAVLEDSDLRHQVDRARARLAAAKATVQQTKQTWERTRAIVESGAGSRDEIDVAEEKYRVAESAVRVEEADVRYHEFKLTETKVTTAVSGVVTRRWVDPGDTIVSGQPVVTVADTSTVWVAANVDQRFAGRVKKGQPATVVLRGQPDKPFRGEVARVNPQADPATEELLVEVAFPLPPEEFRIGQWAEVYIEVGKASDALVVPKAAVLPFGNDRFVFVAGPGGAVRRVKVTPGATSPRLLVVAVTGDLKAGDRVVLKPIGLKGGEVVMVLPAPPAPLAPSGPIVPKP